MNVIVPKTTSKYQNAVNAKTKVDNIMKKLLSESEKELVQGISDKIDINTDAAILTVLNQKYGFTAEQLRTFWEEVRTLQIEEVHKDKDLCTYDYIPQVKSLKENLGIDIIAWNEEEVVL